MKIFLEIESLPISTVYATCKMEKLKKSLKLVLFLTNNSTFLPFLLTIVKSIQALLYSIKSIMLCYLCWPYKGIFQVRKNIFEDNMLFKRLHVYVTYHPNSFGDEIFLKYVFSHRLNLELWNKNQQSNTWFYLIESRL